MVETEFSVVRFGATPSAAAKVYEGVTPLTADDVADCVAFAVTRPSHVNLDQIVVTSRDQALARTIHRRPTRRHCMNAADTPPVFTGVAVALVTFFDAHGHVDLAATARHAEHLAGRGMRALVVAGHHGRGVPPLDEGATAAARRRAGGRAATTCPSSSAPATSPPASACPT